MQVEDAFEFESGDVVVVGPLKGTDRPVVNVEGVIQLESGESYKVIIISSRMPGLRSKPSSMALTLRGVPSSVVSIVRSGARLILTFDVVREDRDG